MRPPLWRSATAHVLLLRCVVAAAASASAGSQTEASAKAGAASTGAAPRDDAIALAEPQQQQAQQQAPPPITAFHVDQETCSGLVHDNVTRQHIMCAEFLGSLANLSAALARTSQNLSRASAETRLRMAVDAGTGWVCPQPQPCTPPYCGCVNITFNGDSKSVAEHVVDLADEILPMDYRTTAAAVYAGALPYLKIADAHPADKKIRVGVAIHNPGGGINNTWEAKNETALAALLNAAAPLLKRHPSFSGFAVFGAWWYAASTGIASAGVPPNPAPPGTRWPAGTGIWYSNHQMITNATTTDRDRWLKWAKSRNIGEVYIAPHAGADALVSIGGVEGGPVNDARFCEFIRLAGQQGMGVQLLSDPKTDEHFLRNCSGRPTATGLKADDVMKSPALKNDDIGNSPESLEVPAACRSANGYTIDVVERALGPRGGSVISFSNGTSDFLFNYNSAYFASNQAGDADGLIVRVQATPKWFENGTEIHFPRSGLAAVRRIGGKGSVKFEHVSMDKVFVSCPRLDCADPLSKECSPTKAQPCADDPRIMYRAKTDLYYLVYDNDLKGRVSMMATTRTPWNMSSWTFYDEPIFKDHPTTSGASLLARDDYAPMPDMHYAFVAIAGDAGPMYIGTSADLIHWNVSDTIWQQGRKGCFDYNGLAAGPPAERLSDGNYLLLYNIDNNMNCQSASCGKCGLDCSSGLPSTCSQARCFDGRCSVGWMILDQQDPSKVLARSEQPLLFAQLLPETVGNATARCLPCTNGNCHPQGLHGCTQTPWVVFANGLQKQPGKDNFVVWFGAGDTNVGAASIRVNIPAATSLKTDDLPVTIFAHSTQTLVFGWGSAA